VVAKEAMEREKENRELTQKEENKFKEVGFLSTLHSISPPPGHGIHLYS